MPSLRRCLLQHRHPCLIYLIPLLSCTTAAVSLSDFKPSVHHLSRTCEDNAYSVTIPGCEISNFEYGNSCSKSCLEGLVYINDRVNEYCQATQDYKLLIAEFLNGNGISVLCPGVLVITASAQHTRHSHPTIRTNTKSQPATLSGTKTIRTTSVRKTGITTDPTSSPTVSSPFTSSPKHSSHLAKTSTTSKKPTPRRTTTTSTRTTPTSSTKPTTSHRTTTSTSTSKSSPTRSSSSTTSASIAAESAAESQCIQYGGDPFSSCPNSMSNNANRSSTSIFTILLLVAAWMYLI